MSLSSDEHIIKCSICGRNLIIKDTVNNSMAFLSHLKIDHGIAYTVQQMTEVRVLDGNKKSNNQLSAME